MLFLIGDAGVLSFHRGGEFPEITAGTNLNWWDSVDPLMDMINAPTDGEFEKIFLGFGSNPPSLKAKGTWGGGRRWAGLYSHAT